MSENIGEHINKKSEEFDVLCAERHAAGQKEYGVFTFLGNDIIRMMAEELADTVNYCRYQFIKLMILQEQLEGQLEGVNMSVGEDRAIQLGMKPFKGVGDIGWQKESES